MTIKRGILELQLFLLAGHDIYGVVKHHFCDAGSSRCHQDRHTVLLDLKKGEAADMILMSMGQDGGADTARLQFFKHRRGIMTDTFGMHPCV